MITANADAAAQSVMARLRDSTAEQHKFAESRRLEQALVRGTVSRELYSAVLAQRYVIHEALEARLRELMRSDERVARVLEERLFQLENLRADLRFLGLGAAHVTARRATARLVAEINLAAAERPIGLLGFYYVFEGSKNGARYIARSIRAAHGLSAGPGTLYLDPHGDEQRPLWLAFKQRMDAAGFDEAEQLAMVAAARIAFDCVSAIDDELMNLPPDPSS